MMYGTENSNAVVETMFHLAVREKGGLLINSKMKNMKQKMVLAMARMRNTWLPNCFFIKPTTKSIHADTVTICAPTILILEESESDRIPNISAN